MGPPWAARPAGSRLVGVVDIPVLVVDDQAPFRKAARFVLERTEGFTCIGDAATGEASVDQVIALAPALVLMDVHLPGIDGIEASRQLTAMPGGPVVVLLSTYDEDQFELEGSGAAAYVAKATFGPDRLAEIWDGHGQHVA